MFIEGTFRLPLLRLLHAVSACTILRVLLSVMRISCHILQGISSFVPISSLLSSPHHYTQSGPYHLIGLITHSQKLTRSLQSPGLADMDTTVRLVILKRRDFSAMREILKAGAKVPLADIEDTSAPEVSGTYDLFAPVEQLLMYV
jgi:hypothetical protein